MEYLPLHFDLKAQRCLVVGGGEIALRKVSLLVSAGADIKLVAPLIHQGITDLAKSSRILIERRKYDLSDLEGACLVIAATNDRSVNQQVSEDARRRMTPVNVVDTPDLCTVIFPGIIDRSPVLMSVSSGGRSPVLTRALREKLETLIPQGYSRLAEFLGSMRAELKNRFKDSNQRRHFVENFLNSSESQEVMEGNTARAEKLFQDETTPLVRGEVYLVGAGPGDPDLLTLKALQLMQKADVVLYDNLVSDTVLARVRRDAEFRYVGKRQKDHSMTQEVLNELLVRLASEGKKVLRLKGGDPFIFGRGGEELEQLVANKIPFHVVPGITAASGCASYAGIPLTHRDYSQSVRFVTGHPKDGEVNLAWQEFAHPNQTIVFYMGLSGLKRICENLIQYGRKPSTPIAIISKGTLPDQQVIIGTLETLHQKVEEAGVKAPTLIIVGEVVKLHASLGSLAKRIG